MSETALKIAITALLEVHQLVSSDNEIDTDLVCDIVSDALRELQREHYLGEPSLAIQEELVGVML